MASRPPADDSTPPIVDVTAGAPTFDDAFAAAAAAENPGELDTAPPKPAETPADPPVDDGGAPPADDGGDPPAEEKPAGGEPAAGDPPVDPKAGEAPPAAAPAAGDPPAAEPKAAEPKAASSEDVLKEIANALKGQPQAEPQVQQQQQAPYSPEEAALIDEYEKNWPDVSQAEGIKRRTEYHDLTKYIFEQVHGFLQPHLGQIAAMGNTLHTQELTSVVPDYTPALEENVTSWIDTQPSYLQGGMKQVMQQGTSEEVADLIGRYRAATGTAPASAAPAASAPAAPAAPAKTELSNLAKKAAESLAPVSSDRTQVPLGEDPNDFDSAFARYASEAAVP